MTPNNPQPELEEEVTNNELARMIAAGFADMQEKMATNEELKQVANTLMTEIDGLRDDVKQMKKAHDIDYISLDTRLTRIEQT